MTGTEGTNEPEVSLTLYAPIKGQVLVKMDGAEEATVVADFQYDVPVKIIMPEGSLYGSSKVKGY